MMRRVRWRARPTGSTAGGYAWNNIACSIAQVTSCFPMPASSEADDSGEGNAMSWHCSAPARLFERVAQTGAN